MCARALLWEGVASYLEQRETREGVAVVGGDGDGCRGGQGLP